MKVPKDQFTTRIGRVAPPSTEKESLSRRAFPEKMARAEIDQEHRQEQDHRNRSQGRADA